LSSLIYLVFLLCCLIGRNKDAYIYAPRHGAGLGTAVVQYDPGRTVTISNCVLIIVQSFVEIRPCVHERNWPKSRHVTSNIEFMCTLSVCPRAFAYIYVTLLNAHEAAWYIILLGIQCMYTPRCLSLCLSVWMYVYNKITFEALTFISAYEGIQVKLVYEGHRVKVKVTGAKKVENPHSRNVQLPSAIIHNLYIKHRSMKCASSMGFSVMADRMV